MSKIPNGWVQFSCSVMSNSSWPHGLQLARLPCPSPTPGACSNSCLSSRWCHPISSSLIPLSSCLQSFPASGSFPVSQFFTSGDQSIGASALASVLPTDTQMMSLPEYPHISVWACLLQVFWVMATVTICSDFGAQENKVCHCFPIYLAWSDGTRCHDLHFLNVEF